MPEAWRFEKKLSYPVFTLENRTVFAMYERYERDELEREPPFRARTPRKRRKRRRRLLTGPEKVLLTGSMLLFGLSLLASAVMPPASAEAGAGAGAGLPDIVTADGEGPESPVSRGEAPVLPSSGKVVTAEDWQLTLVNPWTALPKDYDITLTVLTNGLSVDSRCYPDLQRMMDACREAGLSPVICSAYRSWEKQEELFRNKVDRLIAQGYGQAAAEEEAGRAVAVPGTSEHQLGLALDIVDVNNQVLDSSQEDTAVQKWLIEHSWEYGFILRYPNDKSEVTGIIYEPWHYRYVGREAAAEIHALGVCLEEYLETLAE